MLTQYFRRQAHCLIRRQRTVCIYIQCQFVIVCHLTDMMKVRNLGRKSLEEVLGKLKELGLELNAGDE